MAELHTQLEKCLVHLEYLRAGMDQANVRLDAQNGRLRAVELAATVLTVRVDAAKETGQKWGAGTGAAAGGFVGGLLLALHSIWGGK